ncbi:hypothetical protein DMO24_02215 [Modestobacter versicolor]|uniref:Uncharacterized protein n=1 Tax=Modestobacter versicolor TaxID=429133 RepID=A0A323VEB8_9ACTN|nr:hypothetical protein DMO24_02215 [Modestobacter versicolor]
MVWTFPDVAAAGRAERLLVPVSARQDMAVHDGAVLTWPASARRPRTRGLHSIALDDAVGGDFWAVLFAVVFLLPILPGPDDAPNDAGVSVLAGVGIPDAFTAELRRVAGPGTSALAVLTGTPLPAAETALAALRPRRTSTVFSAAGLRTLRDVFAG